MEHFHYKVVAAGTVCLVRFVSLWIHYAYSENCEGRTGAIGALLLQTTFLKIAWSDREEQRHDTRATAITYWWHIILFHYQYCVVFLWLILKLWPHSRFSVTSSLHWAKCQQTAQWTRDILCCSAVSVALCPGPRYLWSHMFWTQQLNIPHWKKIYPNRHRTIATTV